MIWFNGSPKDSTTCQCCGGCEECPDSDYLESDWVDSPECYCINFVQTNPGIRPECCVKSRVKDGECSECGPAWDGCFCGADTHCITCYGPDPQCG